MNRVKNLAHGLVGKDAGTVYMNRQIRRNWKGTVEGIEPKPDRTAKPLGVVDRMHNYMRQNGWEDTAGIRGDGRKPTPAQARRLRKKANNAIGMGQQTRTIPRCTCKTDGNDAYCPIHAYQFEDDYDD